MPPADKFRYVVAKGKVAFFKSSGGYGFVGTDDHDDGVLFHMEDIEGPDLGEGQGMGFDIEGADKGPRATGVARL